MLASRSWSVRGRSSDIQPDYRLPLSESMNSPWTLRHHWRIRHVEAGLKRFIAAAQAGAARLTSNLLYYSGLLEAARWSQLGRRRGIVILMYHSIGRSRFKNPLNCVSESHFESHLRYLMRCYRVLSLEHAVDLLERGEAPPRGAVVITFDDGYQDNYEIGLRLLIQYRATATIFIATDPVETGRALWQSRLFCWLATTTVPSLRWNARDILPLQSHEERIAAYWVVNLQLRKRDARQRDVLLGEIGEQLGFAANADPPNVVRMLTWSQLLEMTEAGIGVGSHTDTHPVLTSLNPEEALLELTTSKRVLETRLGQPVSLFAYPFGQEEHFDARTQELVKEAGYRAACSTIHGLNRADVDRLALRRMYVPDVPVSVFARILLRCFTARTAN